MRLEQPSQVKSFAEQPPCRKWIARFPSNRTETAALLLNSLRLVSHVDFERSLHALIMKTASGLEGRVALFGAREVSSVTPYFPKDSTRPPDAIATGKEVGSEGRVASLITRMVRESPKKFLNHPSVAELRKVKCHEIFIVDDLIGSGERIIDFVVALSADRHIKSWISGGIVRFTIVAYAATQKGERAILRSTTFKVMWRVLP